MPEFSFKAYAKDGALVADRLSATTQAEAVRTLAARGLAAFEVKSAGRAAPTSRTTKTSPQVLAAFCRQMATMMSSDLPLDEALALMAADSDKRAAALAKELRTAVMQGSTLSAALSASRAGIPDFMVGLVAAGESGGSLSPVFQRLADGFENQIRLVEAIRSALIYPAVLLVTALASLILVLAVVAPALAPVFAGAGDRTPLSAQLLMGASDLLRNWWWLGLLALLGALLLMSAALRSPAGKATLSRLALTAPLVGQVVTSTETSRFLYALAALLENGVSMPNALAITRTAAGNRVIAADIDRIAARVRQGDRLGAALAKSRVFPSIAGQMALVGERSGGLEQMLRHGGRVLEETAQRDVKRLMAVATPALTILLGVLIGGVVLSLLSAIMSVNDLAIGG